MGKDYKGYKALAVLHLAEEEPAEKTCDYDALADQHEGSPSEAVDQKTSEESDNHL